MTEVPIYDDTFNEIKHNGILKITIPEHLKIPDPSNPESVIRRFIRMSDLVPLLQHLLFDRGDTGFTLMPILSVHCRRDPKLPCIRPIGKYKIKHLTPRTNPKYLLIEAHGRYTEIAFALDKGRFEDDTLYNFLTNNIFYRTPIGSLCRQLEYHQIYDNDIRCRISGSNPEIRMTDDALMIEGMRISIRHMTLVCDEVMLRQGTLCNESALRSPLTRSWSLPQRVSTPYGVPASSSMGRSSVRKKRNSKWLRSQSLRRKKNRQMYTIQESTRQSGGTRKRKTRRR